jgi:hypothetical protein
LVVRFQESWSFTVVFFYVAQVSRMGDGVVTWVQVSGMARSPSPNFHGTTKILNSLKILKRK